jgi:aspartyl-tRNA(Asn)/glutamyl-tRNA(Gln) amidotransferase subunit B
MRSKEEAHDYRYFPDPDLPPIHIGEAEIEARRAELPPSPSALRAEWVGSWGLTAYDAQVLAAHPALARYFGAVADALTADLGEARRAEAGKRAANFVQSEVLAGVETSGLEASFPVAARRVAETLSLVDSGRISGKIAKRLYALLCEEDGDPEALIEEHGWVQVSDLGEIEGVVRRVLDANPEQRAAYQGGKTKMLGFFVGQVMKDTQGKANPKLVNEVLRRLLGGS